jgi:hypothetical protein
MRICNASVPLDSTRKPDCPGCAASSGASAVRSGVLAVAGSACVTGRSNAVAGGLLAQAVSNAAAQHSRKMCLVVPQGDFVLGALNARLRCSAL